MQLCGVCESTLTAWICSNCNTAVCESCHFPCRLCKVGSCGNCMPMCTLCFLHENVDIAICEKCRIECSCHGKPYCPDCAPKPCGRCKKIFCEDTDLDHLAEHHRQFVLIYMVLGLQCNLIILEALDHAMKSIY